MQLINHPGLTIFCIDFDMVCINLDGAARLEKMLPSTPHADGRWTCGRRSMGASRHSLDRCQFVLLPVDSLLEFAPEGGQIEQ